MHSHKITHASTHMKSCIHRTHTHIAEQKFYFTHKKYLSKVLTWLTKVGCYSEAEEVVECALSPERPQLLKRRGAGKGAGVMGSVAPNALVTAPLSSRRAHLWEGNRRGHRSGSWVEPTGCDADARRATPRDV
jgi:hypothetical protein